MFMRTADHAAVNETVSLAPQRSRGFVNAILRNYLRKKDITAAQFEEGINLVTSDGYPLGFVKRIGNRVNNTYPNSLKINNL